MRVFRDVGLVEQLGSGMGRILNAYDKSVFCFVSDFLIVTFPFSEGFDATINANKNANGTNDGINGTNNGSEVILNAFRSNPDITIQELARITGISVRTINREIEKLKVAEKLKRIGSPRAGHWEVHE